MNISTTKTSEYMILFRSNGWDQDLSPQELQKIMSQTLTWLDRLQENGKLKAGQPLYEEGKVISGKKGRNVADGPFAESKETIAGYLLLNVDTLDEAVSIAQGWPLLDCGCTVEVRPVAPECPSFQRIQEEMALAAV